ncbi:hypothetical protein D3C80_1874710 [compost metagenome]
MKKKPIMVASMPDIAIIQFVYNIIITAPRNVTTAVINVPRLLFKVCPIVSTSLVTRLSTSPVLCLLKYESGKRLILPEISLRSFFVIR